MTEHDFWLPAEKDGERPKLRVAYVPAKEETGGHEEMVISEDVYDTRERPMRLVDRRAIELTLEATVWLARELARIAKVAIEIPRIPPKKDKRGRKPRTGIDLVPPLKAVPR